MSAAAETPLLTRPRLGRLYAGIAIWGLGLVIWAVLTWFALGMYFDLGEPWQIGFFASAVLTVAWVLGGPIALFAPAVRSRARVVVVGADGLLLGDRFVAFADVARLERERPPHPRGRIEHYASLVLRSGETVSLGPVRRTVRLTLDELDAAYDDLDARITAARARRRPRHAVDLARGDQREADWLARLRALGAPAGTFRERAVPRDALLAVVEHPRSTPDARAGAAFALRAGLTDDERARVRVAATAIAAPRARVALEAVADEEMSEEKVAKLVAKVGE